ncbi:MAG TPA: PDZ domain-containing protein [Vicinamibacterales bacterium]|nr:PDZ domain-containing protein [Vicinamibacterales bacterium]
MRTLRIASLTVLLGLVTAAAGPVVSARVDTADTKLLTQPAISANHIAFVYAGDLFVADLGGGGAVSNVRRLTTDDGVESNPVFSPDGKTIAFSAQYDGNVDVFTVPVAGGAPTRLTWHPVADVVQAFTPDGKSVLFTSQRATFTTRYSQLFTVPVQGGIEEALPIPNAARATYSPDGQRIAYNPIAARFQQWKQYRGGTVSRLWLYNTKGHAIEKVPQPESRSNDTDPMWIGDTVYFRSDRGGEFNIFAYDTKSRQVRQLTKHADFPVLSAGYGAGRIVYEQAGSLHVLDPQTGNSKRLTIGVASDLRETRPRFVKGARWIRDAALSPTGARAAFGFRGEILTVPGEKGDVRNLTNSVAAHDRFPAWSPDGRSLAWFSDQSGEYQLYIGSQDGKGEARAIKVAGEGFYNAPEWSPDSQKIAYFDNSQSVYWVDVKSGVAKKIAAQPIYGPEIVISYEWSPDSKWLAYAMDNQSMITTVYAYSTEQGKSLQVSDGLSDVSNPVFDKSGKYLFFFGSTDAGPVKDWFAQSNADMRATSGIYLAVLQNDQVSPLARESDEEKPAAADQTPDKKPEPKPAEPGTAAKDKPAAPTPEEKAPAKKDAPFRIDFDGLEYRILDLPITPADLSSLQTGTAGQVYYLKTVDGKASLNRYDLSTRKNETLLPEVTSYLVSADGKKLLYRNANAWSIVPTTRKIEPAEGRIAVDAIEVRVDPRAEWKQIFDEAWRINRDYFYAPNMHGVDWAKQREKYAAFLPDVATRADLNRVLQWMSSELSVGHHNVGGGDSLAEPRTVPGGLLGADYEIANGRYRLKKVFGGLNWNPQLRAPLTEPGVNAKAGEYVLAVNGRDLRPPTNLYSLFENTSGKIVELTLGPNADGSGSRTVQVVPIANDGALRNRDWVESNLKKVDKATGGRVAYVYVPNTGGSGHSYFKRYFYPQVHKDAIIVDERFNGGGSVADYYIDILRRPFIANWAMRYGADLKTPFASIQGPKAMIIDETAGSGGDLLPWMFRKYKMGPLVGQRTWGGLVGILGFPVLMDGGTITAPNLAIWTPEDGWVVENEGVPPDVEVEQTPADVIAGRDPQLEKAIELVMAELKKSPPSKPSRPAYPVRGKTQRGTYTNGTGSPGGR